VNVVLNLLEFQCFVDSIFLEYAILLGNWFLVFQRNIALRILHIVHHCYIFDGTSIFKLLLFIVVFLNQKYDIQMSGL
jgi:hypothetical protein